MSSAYLTRSALLLDMQARLKAAALPHVEGRVYVSRVTAVPKEKFPALLLYAAERRHEPLGASWQFEGDVTLVLEVQVAYSEDLAAGAWAALAEEIGHAALVALLGDAAWRRLWRGPPSFGVKQYLRGKDVAVPHVGEATTITGTPLRNLEVPLAHQRITGADVALTLAQRTDDAPPDLEQTWESPE